MECPSEDVCREVVTFSRKVLKDRVERTGRSRQADVAMDGNWSRARTDQNRYSLFARKFPPGDLTSRKDIPFAVGVRGVYGNPTLRAIHSIHKCVAKDAPHLFH